MRASRSWIVLCAGLLAAPTAGSEELMGITIYPGSKVEPGFTDTIRKVSPGSTCYQTVDGLAKVVDFYRSHKGLELVPPPPGRQSAATIFQKAPDGMVRVQIQSLPAKPSETYFCIAKGG